MNLPLPRETREYFGNDKNRILKISNLGLLFNKYVFSWQNGWQMKEEHSKEFREALTKILFAKEYVSAASNRQKAAVESLKKSGWYVEPFAATTDSCLIIGLGGASVIETGMTLHPLYGFPYLPGSGLKGLARAYAEIGADVCGNELLEVFGSEDKKRHSPDNRQGRVFFMDGLPTAFPSLELDIMNPHYSDYYSGKKDSKGNPIPPADYLNPVPVTFLAVASGQTFSFAVLSRDNDLAAKAKEWLVGGLTQLGAGGKTNVGYGYFKPPAANQSSNGKAQNTVNTAKNTPAILWENAFLNWNPGNKTLTATLNNKKAEIQLGDDRSMVPEAMHKKLFGKKDAVKGKVTVEPLGSAFKIIKIEPPG